jgi:hypothetical protein
MIDKKQIIAQAAYDLGIVDASWLYSLISFESGLNPLAINSKSGARGLIQIMPSTAQSMFGMSVDVLINQFPDFESQVKNVVVPYLSHYKPFPSKQSLYLAVFYPAARGVAPDTTFYSLYKQYSGTNWLEKYKIFLVQNPGILTVNDYINYVERLRIKDFFLPIILLALIVTVKFFKK